MFDLLNTIHMVFRALLVCRICWNHEMREIVDEIVGGMRGFCWMDDLKVVE